MEREVRNQEDKANKVVACVVLVIHTIKPFIVMYRISRNEHINTKVKSNSQNYLKKNTSLHQKTRI